MNYIGKVLQVLNVILSSQCICLNLSTGDVGSCKLNKIFISVETFITKIHTVANPNFLGQTKEY